MHLCIFDIITTQKGVNMAYIGLEVKKYFEIKKIFSVHYFEYLNDFVFDGEKHNFWEFICVDNGNVDIKAGDKKIHLKKGELAFHEPGEFHAVSATGDSAPNIIVVSFSCNDKAMNFFKKKLFKIDEKERNLLSDIIIEAKQLFSCRLDDPYLQNMPIKNESLFASTQMLSLYIAQFLIHIYRRYQNPRFIKEISTDPVHINFKSYRDKVLFLRVIEYMKSHISEKLTISMICKENLVGKSQLQQLFKYYLDIGIIDYFNHLKINTAKTMIRNRRLNFTEISEKLGYNSIHYFSRQFKEISGMTASEYLSSIKALAEKGFNEF